MADLSVTATDVALVESPRYPRTHPAGAAVDAGAPVYLDTSGYVREADANSGTAEARDPIGLAVTSAAAANLPVTVAGPDALVDVGPNALGDLAFGATVYLSDTAGLLADADATGSAAVMGTVVPAYGATTADKLLRISGALNG